MRYLGGKYRLRKQIASYLASIRLEGQAYWEPFVGSASVLSEMTGKRYASDASKELIAMWQAVQRGWVPPDSVTEEEYALARDGHYPDRLTGFIAYGCSWGGKWFGGYARGENRNYANEAGLSLVRQAPSIIDVHFENVSFLSAIAPAPRCLIYCDPPYASTTGYGNVPAWSVSDLWARVRELGDDGHTVVVSEYAAPSDFECVLEMNTSTDLRGKNGRERRIEKLFRRDE